MISLDGKIFDTENAKIKIKKSDHAAFTFLESSFNLFKWKTKFDYQTSERLGTSSFEQH